MTALICHYSQNRLRASIIAYRPLDNFQSTFFSHLLNKRAKLIADGHVGSLIVISAVCCNVSISDLKKSNKVVPGLTAIPGMLEVPLLFRYHLIHTCSSGKTR